MKNEAYNLIRKDIQIKTGKEVLHGKDWLELADQISNETQRHISVSTLKRFFGIIQSPFNPSKYTLETLARFMGFEDWHDYQNYYDDSEFINPDGETWEILKNRMKRITMESLHSMKEKSDFLPENFIKREFAEVKFSGFLGAAESVAFFSAPDNYGKSTTLIHLAEQFLDPENQKYNNDILLLIDGEIFFQLYAQGSNYEVLDQFLEFKATTSIDFYFNRNPEKRKGRFIVMIDDLDSIYHKKERFNQVMENLMRMVLGSESRWHKIIFTCRPENLDVLYELIAKNPAFGKCCYKSGYNSLNPHGNKNIPSFSDSEVNSFMHNFEINPDLKILDPIFAMLISQPPFLYLLIKLRDAGQPITAANLLQGFIQRVTSGAFRDEKMAIINSFIELSNWGKEKEAVEKWLLFSDPDFCRTAYRLLLSKGVLHEFDVNEGLLGTNTYVKFSIKPVFAYLLLTKWRNQEKDNSFIMQGIRTFYSSNKKLRIILLQLTNELLRQEKNPGITNQLRLQFEQSEYIKKEDKRKLTS